MIFYLLQLLAIELLKDELICQLDLDELTDLISELL